MSKRISEQLQDAAIAVQIIEECQAHDLQRLRDAIALLREADRVLEALGVNEWKSDDGSGLVLHRIKEFLDKRVER